MAFPTAFAEETGYLSRPENMTDEQCSPLSVFRGVDNYGNPIVISCWKLTAQELAEVNRTGRIWLGIVGVTMPPAWVLGESPFEPPKSPQPDGS